MLGTLIRNLSSQWLLYLLNAGMLLGITPLLMHGLGPSGFGVWVVAGNLVAWLMVLDFGVNAATVRSGAVLIREGRGDQFQSLFHASLFLFLLIGLAVAGIGLLLGGFLPARFFGEVMSRSDFIVFFALLGLALAFGFWGQPFAAVLQAHQRFDHVNYVKAVALLLRIGGYGWVIVSGYGLLGLALVTYLSSLLTWGGLMLLSRRLFAWRIRLAAPERLWLSRLFGFGWLVLVVVVADQVRFQTDSIVIAAFASLPAVALFGIAATLSTVFRDVVGAVVSMLVPVFARDEIDVSFRARFLMATRVFALAVWSLGGLIVVFGGPFIELWMGPEFVDGAVILQVLMAGLLVASAQTMSFSLLYGRAMHAPLAVLSVADALANIGLSLWLVQGYGALGVALGTALPLVVTYALVFPWLVRRALGCTLLEYVREALLRPALWGAAVMGAAFAVVWSVHPASWLSLVLEVTAMAGGCLILGWYLGFGRAGRAFLRDVASQRRPAGA
ncbi:MAG TPA: polysaccharide biosynthesis C-terminal domain-containing protein [Mariprofundaceae bacterium]|nr:polysaccharide biosynthesis C-terminal domain-containing protein [Mariprofundaceae bacterium]